MTIKHSLNFPLLHSIFTFSWNSMLPLQSFSQQSPLCKAEQHSKGMLNMGGSKYKPCGGLMVCFFSG